MIPRLVRFVLRMPAFVLILALGLLALGLYCYQQLDIEAYPEPGGADDRDHHPADRLERRGGRALRDHPARKRAERDARSRPHPVAVAVRPLGREVLLHLERRVPRRAAAGPEPARLRQPAAGDDAAAVALERHRRGLPLRGARRGLLAGRSEDGAGLDPRAAVPPGPGRHRRGRLRRRDQGVPRRGRPLSPEGARGDADPAGERAGVVESERRRPAAQHRRAVVRRARDRHHPFAGRHPRRGPLGAEGDADPRARRGRGDRRARAAAGDRRQGSRSRRGAGDGADALRRRLAEDARMPSTSGSTT